MTPTLELKPATLKAGEVILPGSKSISNRVLLLSALSNGICKINNLLESDDTHYMCEALKTLGIKLERHSSGSLIVHGCGGQIPVKKADLFLGNAGTAFRPLTAVLALSGGEYTLHGTARMHERPIGDLVNALSTLGAKIEYQQTQGYPPLHIYPFENNHIDIVKVAGNVSSQFLTALLMALPLLNRQCMVEVVGDLISKPYIDITLNLLERFGVHMMAENHQYFRLANPCHYLAPEQILVEGDASSASYFLAGGFLSAVPITVRGVGKNSIQGDIAFVSVLESLGANVTYGDDFITVSRDKNLTIKPFDIDANAIPDSAMTLAIVALATNGTSQIRNIASWRVKETDRINAMQTELQKLGATVESGEDFIRITPPKALKQGVSIATYDDHRMAMCFALVCLLQTHVIIEDPACVNKTFPEFFMWLQQLINH